VRGQSVRQPCSDTHPNTHTRTHCRLKHALHTHTHTRPTDAAGGGESRAHSSGHARLHNFSRAMPLSPNTARSLARNATTACLPASNGGGCGARWCALARARASGAANSAAIVQRTAHSNSMSGVHTRTGAVSAACSAAPTAAASVHTCTRRLQRLTAGPAVQTPQTDHHTKNQVGGTPDHTVQGLLTPLAPPGTPLDTRSHTPQRPSALPHWPGTLVLRGWRWR
jgi:hypothetical protein